MRERFKEEFQNRYGEGLTDEELRVAAREEMIGRMQAQLKEEGIDVNGVTGVMEEMSKRNRELFKLPPYVLYVSRAFSTLEGIGLSVNADYSILQQCYPYLSKRLLSDNSPRSKNALKLMLFGGSNSVNAGTSAGGMFSPSKLLEMSDGLATYTTAVSDADNTEGAKQAQNALADVVLDPNGNYLQELLLEEAAKVTDAAIRDQFQKLKNSPPGRLFKTALKAPRDVVYRFVPEALRPLALPLSLPYDVVSRLVKAVGKDSADEASLQTVGTMWNAIEPQLRTAMTDGGFKLGNGVNEIESPVSPAMAMKNKSPTDLIKTTPSPPPSVLSQAPKLIANAAIELQKQVSDPKSQLRLTVEDPKFRERLPVVGTLTRKFGAILLERASSRLKSESSTTKVIDNKNGIIRNSNSDLNKGEIHQQDDSLSAVLTERLLLLTATAAQSAADIITPTTAFLKTDANVE